MQSDLSQSQLKRI